MHLIPANKNEWQALVPGLFKAYVVSAYIVWKFISQFISGENSPFAPPSTIMVGYFLSIVVLSFVAGNQVGKKQNQAAIRTIVFIAIGFAFVLVSFQAASILNRIVLIANILANCLVLFYAINARRRQKMRTLTFWIWASSISLIREPGLFICNYILPPLGNNTTNIGRTDFWGMLYNFPITSFLDFYWLGYLLAGVLYVAGILLTIQKLQSKEPFNPSPNTAMYVALGFLASMILMGISFMCLGRAEFLPTIAINAAVLYFCFLGYRQIKLKAFIFWGLAAILSMVRIIGLDMFDWYHNSIHNGGIYTIEQWLIELLLLGGTIAIVFWSTGVILLIRSVSNQQGQPTG
jgi:hypothetical protein